MATEVSNIDELLSGATSSQTPPVSESNYDPQPETSEVSYDEPESHDSKSLESLPHEQHTDEPDEDTQKESEIDDYGNTKTPPKTYTEEEVNERINKAMRERLARGKNNAATAPQPPVALQPQDFNYNPESEDSWESQLEKFVEKTFSKIGQKQAQQQQQMRDEAQQAEFEDKFTRGMNRFNDFRDVVGNAPVTDPMTYALRGLSDPAAFIYAASKRHPQELIRISQIQDPASQIMEMGRLEERMRKSAPGTKAPRPISRSREDSGLPITSKKKEPSIEDLIAQSDAKRKAQFNQRRGR